MFVPVFAHKYRKSSKIQQINASKAAKSPAEKTVLLPCKLRKPELSLHGQRKSLPSSGSDHLVLEMISMSHEYNVPFLSAGVQGNSHPADSSKVCELDEGRHAVAPDSCHTGSICRYGYSTHARVLSSGLGAVAFIH